MGKIYLHIAPREDGFGAQFSARVQAWLLCRVGGFTYCHSPITLHPQATTNGLECIYQDPARSSQEFLENSLGFGKGEITHQSIQDLPHFSLGEFTDKYGKLTDFYNSPIDKDLVITEAFFHQELIEASPTLITEALQDLRKKFKAFMDKNTPPFEAQKTHIALHIRRGDQPPSSNWRYIPNEYYINLLNEFRENYTNPHFHVFSEGTKHIIPFGLNIFKAGARTDLPTIPSGEPLDFSWIESDDVTFHLDTGLDFAFHCGMLCDVLVLGASSLFWPPALVNAGDVYYIRLYDLLMPPHWTALPFVGEKDAGEFDESFFEDYEKSREYSLLEDPTGIYGPYPQNLNHFHLPNHFHLSKYFFKR